MIEIRHNGEVCEIDVAELLKVTELGWMLCPVKDPSQAIQHYKDHLPESYATWERNKLIP